MKTIKKSIGIIICIVMAACMFILSANANATVTYEVGAGKPYATIQAAIDAVMTQTVTEPTDFVISIAAGTYEGPFKIRQQANKNVTFIGESAESVVLTGGECPYYRDGKAAANGYAVFMVDGAARGAGVAETMLFKNLTLSYTLPASPLTGVTWVDLISFARYELIGSAYCYAHNVTIDGCVFKDSADAHTAIGLRLWNTAYNITIKNTTASGMHSFGQGQANGYTVLNCTMTNSGCAFNFQSSSNVLVDNCDFGECVEEVLKIGQGGSATALLNTSMTVTNCTASLQNPNVSTGGFLVIRATVPKTYIINNNNIGNGTINCTSAAPATTIAQIEIDLSDNYWGTEAPVFEEKILGFTAAGIQEAITPTEYFVTETLETLNTDCVYVGYHTYDDNWYEVTAPSCCAEGAERRNCTNERCDDVTAFETRPIAATGAHVYSAVYTLEIAPTCVAVGEERAYCTTEGCTAYISREVPVAPDAHNLGAWAIETSETCSATGSNRRYCSNEGCGYYEETIRPIIGHVYSVLEEVIYSPTCVSAGSARYGCTMCELTEIRTYGVPTGVHTWGEWTVTKEPTVSEAGSRTRSCTAAGCTATETEEIPVTGFAGVINWLILLINKITELVNTIFANLGF